MYEVQCTKYEIRWKYTRNKPSPLGEIGNSGAISNYFTEPSAAGMRSEVYFYGISTVFLSNYFTERSEVYFYPISIVSRISPACGRQVLRTLYLVQCTIPYFFNSRAI